jgi:ArsR family transcriptional regulator, arsenate/arsenite/antimonite-responsive transcriptional repressor
MTKTVSKRFKALANENRLKIFVYLRENSDDVESIESCCSVGDVAGQFDLALSTVSHHLKVLNDANLICCEQDGQRVICTVNKDAVDELRIFFNIDTEEKE